MKKKDSGNVVKFGYTDILLIVATIIWGLNPTIIKLGLREMPNILFNISRTVVACITCWIILFIYEKDWKIDKKDLSGIIGISLLGHFIYQVFFINGISMTTAGNASLIFSLLPVMIVLISIIFRIEKINIYTVIGIIVSFSGIIFVIIGSGKNIALGNNFLSGDLMIMVATLSWALTSILIRKYLDKYSPLKITTYGITIGLISMLAFWSGNAEFHILKDLSKVAIFSIIFSGVLALGIASVFWNIGVLKIGSVKTSIYNNITPVVSIICGIIVLNEKFGLLQGIGSLMILCGFLLTKLEIKKRDLKSKSMHL